MSQNAASGWKVEPYFSGDSWFWSAYGPRGTRQGKTVGRERAEQLAQQAERALREPSSYRRRARLIPVTPGGVTLAGVWLKVMLSDWRCWGRFRPPPGSGWVGGLDLGPLAVRW